MANANTETKDRIAFALAQQALRGSSGYNHYAHLGQMKFKASELNKRAQMALVKFANNPDDPQYKMLMQRIDQDSMPESQAAVEMISQAQMTANGLQGDDLKMVVDSILKNFPSQSNNGEFQEGQFVSDKSLVPAQQPEKAENILSSFEKSDDPMEAALAKHSASRLNELNKTMAKLDKTGDQSSDVYNRYAPQRQELRDVAVATIMTNMLSRADKNGVLNIQFEADNFYSQSVAGHDASAAFSTDPQGYFEAIKSMYSGLAGVKVGGVGTYKFETFSNDDLLVTNQSTTSKGGGLMIYVVTDLDAERKVTLLATAAATEIGNMKSLLRTQSINHIKEEVGALRELINEIRKKEDLFEKNFGTKKGQYSVVSVQVKAEQKK